MTKKFLLSLICSVTLFQSACAQEEGSVESEVIKEAQVQTTNPGPEVSAVVEQVSKVLPAFTAPDSAWREPDPQNTLYIDTVHGRIVVELYPEIAPIHVQRIKKLTKEGFYDGVLFHRVIDGFMNQTGDPNGDGTGDSPYADLEAEFAFSRNIAKMPVKLMGDMKSKLNGNNAITGFYKALPVATPSDDTLFMTKKGQINSYGLHCKGVASMARTQIPNSANSQFFLMRDEYRSLDSEYSIWGATIYGHEVLTKIKIGVVGEVGFTPDSMVKVRLASDIPESERLPIQVMRTDTDDILNYTDWLKKQNGRRPKICKIQIPSRLKK